MIGYMRSYKAENFLIEPKEAQKKFNDLRITTPWPELEAFASQWDFKTIDELNEHNHVPYGVILIQAIKKWKASHEG